MANGEKFVSEPLTPMVGDADTSAMARGEPGLAQEFTWRGKPFRIAEVLRTWRETGACRHGSSESYVRRHCYEVRTTDGRRATLYFERQAKGRKRTQRWWLRTIERAASE